MPANALAGAAPKTVGDEMAKAAAEYKSVMGALVSDSQAGRDLKPDLEALKELEAKYPPLSDLLTVVQAKLSLLPKYGKPGEVNEYAKAIVTKGVKREDDRLLGLAYSILRNEKESKESLALALQAAETVVRIDGGKNARSLLNLADAYLVNGDNAAAKECAHRAIEAAAHEPPTFRQEIKKEAQKLGSEK